MPAAERRQAKEGSFFKLGRAAFSNAGSVSKKFFARLSKSGHFFI
jgi:hypothetical protein